MSCTEKSVLRIGFTAFCLAFMLSLAPVVYAALPGISSSPVGLGIAPHIVKMPNGLTLVAVKTREETLAMRLVVPGNIEIMPYKDSNLPHLVEHMAFVSGPRFPGGSVFDFAAERGVPRSLGIIASPDSFQLNIPVGAAFTFSDGLTVLEEVGFNQKFSERSLATEKESILAEAFRGSDENIENDWIGNLIYGREIHEEYFDRLKKEVRAHSLIQTQRHYFSRYRPERMTLVVVGPIDIAHVEEEVRQRLGGKKSPSETPAREDSHPDNLFIFGSNRRINITKGLGQDSKVHFIKRFVRDELFSENRVVSELSKRLFVKILNKRWWSAEYVTKMDGARAVSLVDTGNVSTNVSAIKTSFVGVHDFRRLTELYARMARELADGISPAEFASAKDELKREVTSDRVGSEPAAMSSIDISNSIVRDILRRAPIGSSLEDQGRFVDLITKSMVDELAAQNSDFETDFVVGFWLSRFSREEVDKSRIDAIFKPGYTFNPEPIAAETAQDFLNRCAVPLSMSDPRAQLLRDPLTILNPRPESPEFYKLPNGVRVLFVQEKGAYPSVNGLRGGGVGVYGRAAADISAKLATFPDRVRMGRKDALAINRILPDTWIELGLDNSGANIKATSSDSLEKALQLLTVAMLPDPGRNCRYLGSFQETPAFADPSPPFDSASETGMTLDGAELQKIYDDRFTKAGDFVFVVAADDNDASRALVARYLGALDPDTSEVNQLVRSPRKFLEGRHDSLFPDAIKGITRTKLYWSSNRPISGIEHLKLMLLREIVTQRLLARLQYVEGGVYDPTARLLINDSFDLDRLGSAAVIGVFQSFSERAEPLTRAAIEEVNALRNGELSDQDFSIARDRVLNIILQSLPRSDRYTAKDITAMLRGEAALIDEEDIANFKMISNDDAFKAFVHDAINPKNLSIVRGGA
jgi:predicted Zn-dependent peptidase